MLVAAKSEDLEFYPPYLGIFSKGDAQLAELGDNFRPEAAAQD
jgi:hypothetical protein